VASITPDRKIPQTVEEVSFTTSAANIVEINWTSTSTKMGSAECYCICIKVYMYISYTPNAKKRI